MLTVEKMLENYGLDLTKNIKIVRHKDEDRIDVVNLYEKGQLELYQKHQKDDVFGECEYVVSFLGFEEGKKAVFIGVYKVLSKSNPKKFITDKLYDWMKPEYKKGNEYYYEMEKVQGFGELEGRIIINWSERTFHMWFAPLKKVKATRKRKQFDIIEIIQKGAIRKFPGFLDFTLTFNDLKKLYDNPDVNSTWCKMLSSVAGIYTILDRATGKLYIGKGNAYGGIGKGGIWGRWESYAKTGHGGNKRLMELLESNPERKEDFLFSILRTLPKTITNDEILDIENIYKEKLGTREFGYNAN
ncbi:TPA: GIY-YIG nuclease family protein [Bacillus wiedmannii]|nr:GIY-YIG nuclease family protein [Bacillus wiedmannii]